MADETKGIAGKGLGFFSTEGVLKSKEQLAADNSKSQKSESAQPPASTDSVSTEFREKTSDAFGKVEARFVEKANNVISTINESESDLRDARKVVNEQLAAAKDLRDALKDKDDAKEAQAREKLSRLQSDRAELAKEIKEKNAERAPNRVQNLNLGNEQRSTVKVGEVKFSTGSNADPDRLDSVKKVNELISQLKDDQKAIKSQVSDLRAVKKEVKETVKEVRQTIRDTRKEVISSFDQAEKTSRKIADEIRSGGIELVEKTISKGLTPENVARFIEPGA